MVDKLKLQARIIEQGETISSIASKLGVSPYTLGKKLSNQTIMTLGEAGQLQQILRIKDKDFMNYFFAHDVANRNGHKNPAP